MSVLERWREFRHAQREALRASNHPHERSGAPTSAGDLLADVLPGLRHRGEHDDPASDSADGGEPPSHQPAPAEPAAAAGPVTHEPQHTTEGEPKDGKRGLRYGTAGRPLNRQSPFYMGFVGALGVLAALLLWQTLGRLTTTITLVVVAFFLTLALNPLVEFLTRRGVRRPGAVAIVFAGVVVVFTLIGLLVVPPVVQQGGDLAAKSPDYLNQLLNNPFVKDIDQHYQVVDKIEAEFNKRLTDGNFIGQVFGGVLGVGAAVIGGIFQAFTVLVLTLFLLASLPRVKQAAYAMVPASRRPRVISLSEEIMRRTGSYAIGQVAVATINAICSYFMMVIVGIPYAAVLAVAVGFLGLVPMVGATIGAAIVVLVAVFTNTQDAIIAAVYYLVYQQVENYLIAPKIMQRTVSVPGAVTVVAALAGGSLLGVLGALLAIPVAAGLLLLYEEVLLPRQRRH
ncbi:AI-2E family transporter [Pedococcus aerophilus]|uniref:AI-2E family transporter n=1 Tax=Pedococcus aerophilus TaxID=436356 RepID=A0ABN3UIS7_9MICO